MGQAPGSRSKTIPLIGTLYRAFLNSLNGFSYALRNERAVRQEALVFALAAPCAFALAGVSWTSLLLLASLAAVICVELLNTGLERLCDLVDPNFNQAIGRIKDMASAACLTAQAVAGMVWLFALWERLT